MAMITSLTNPRIKNVVRLQQQARHRRQHGLFCVESARELVRALDAGFKVAELYTCDEMIAERELEPLMQRASEGADTDSVNRPVLEKLAYRENPQGFVAVMRWRHVGLDAIPASDTDWFILCSGLEKPGNIGAIVRSADAAGASAVLIDNPTSDVFNPNAIRASTGAVFTVPIVCAEAGELIAGLRTRGVRLIAVTPEAGQRHTDADLSGPLAIVLGAEAVGLAEIWRDACGGGVSIPMRGTVDSINVSVAAAVVMFELARQRSQ